MELVATSGRPLSELIAGFRSRYHISGEINSTVSDAQAVLQELRERYADGRQAEIDGLSVDYDDWHFNVRASNTEPLLRLNLEAQNPAEMQRRRDEVLALVRG
jgi:phosphomannomutase